MAGRDEEFRRSILAGGKVLGDGGAQFLPPPRTSHVTDFNGCVADIICMTQQVLVTDEGGESVERDEVVGYAIRINDQLENHLYVYKFDVEGRDVFRDRLTAFPAVGEYMPLEDPPVMQ